MENIIRNTPVNKPIRIVKPSKFVHQSNFNSNLTYINDAQLMTIIEDILTEKYKLGTSFDSFIKDYSNSFYEWVITKLREKKMFYKGLHFSKIMMYVEMLAPKFDPSLPLRVTATEMMDSTFLEILDSIIKKEYKQGSSFEDFVKFKVTDIYYTLMGVLDERKLYKKGLSINYLTKELLNLAGRYDRKSLVQEYDDLCWKKINNRQYSQERLSELKELLINER